MVIVIILCVFSYANYVHGISNIFFGQWRTSALNEPQPPLIKPHTHKQTHTRTHMQTNGWLFFYSMNDCASSTTVCVSHRIYINKYFHHPAHSTAHTAEPRLLFIFGYFAFDSLFSISLCPLNSTERTLHVWNAILPIHPSILWYTIWKPHIHSSHYTLAFACTATFTYNIICFGRIWILIIVVKHALPSQQNTHTNTHPQSFVIFDCRICARNTEFSVSCVNAEAFCRRANKPQTSGGDSGVECVVCVRVV